MKTITLFSILFIVTLFCNAQVGINTEIPKATLDIGVANPAAPENTDGILVPRIDAFPLVNPTSDQDGMLVYLTTTEDSNSPGFYFWNSSLSSWSKVMVENSTMLCGKSGGSIGLTGTVFNFPDLKFNNILGAYFVGDKLHLPPGNYEIESKLSTSPNLLLGWDVRVDGIVCPTSIAGSANTISLGLGLGVIVTGVNTQSAIVTITDASEEIDFVITSGVAVGGLLSDSSYLKITKL
ncbi:hypothetical protein LY01_01534 [Nonlabens xylanidelens]|uniref:Uncharacterized protein n=1 Tax=Nonlabens xylanidelens TaxID=191564 RepID=A0A2S6IKM0_9FLAO|nr:hypothetical protein [Nonlabens xylanidelens]PPK94782.1 hypothetical protein LY01_01534 [Nonlabens xylanidelens]PQJ17345.1 hypothetical protein BST94_09765 [Nonlabens xylanidelens]